MLNKMIKKNNKSLFFLIFIFYLHLPFLYFFSQSAVISNNYYFVFSYSFIKDSLIASLKFYSGFISSSK